MIAQTWLVIALPLLGFFINGLFGPRLNRRLINLVAIGSVGLAFLVAFILFIQFLGLSADRRLFTIHLWSWITIANFNAPMSLLLDPLSLQMVLIVTGISFLIHLYSAGYMVHRDAQGNTHPDPHYSRFFSFLNLFVGSMLILVLADNYLLLYVGWELVGLCSYLLIGFWFQRPAAVEAGKKAFIVNRVGDFGFALGILLIWSNFGSLNYGEVFKAAPTISHQALTGITLLLFLGAIGKSAQLPLYVWLPDAMEGPTPVSALIHAATMVTAGVYMIARNNLLYSYAPETALLVAIIGSATALFAASIALVQNDLKRILAYSTISQLGYMFMAVGIGAHVAGMFHLTTHAFFKALLFLAAGSIMHALHDVVDIRRMGGLRKQMPITYAAFLVGGMALAGFPLLSGFFSKDEILMKALEYSPWLYAIGLLTALFTAFYTFRALLKVFHGSPRDIQLSEMAGESKPVMTIPLVVLALLALFGGLIGLPSAFGMKHALNGWLGPVFVDISEGRQSLPMGSESTMLMVSSIVAIAGISWAYWWYQRRPSIPGKLSRQFPGLYNLVLNKYYVDEVYLWLFVNPIKSLAKICAENIDRQIIDGVLDGGAASVLRLGRIFGNLQNGYLSQYVLATFIGMLIMVVYFFLR